MLLYKCLCAARFGLRLRHPKRLFYGHTTAMPDGCGAHPVLSRAEPIVSVKSSGRPILNVAVDSRVGFLQKISSVSVLRLRNSLEQPRSSTLFLAAQGNPCGDSETPTLRSSLSLSTATVPVLISLVNDRSSIFYVLDIFPYSSLHAGGPQKSQR